jgi:hypothetical protein
VATVHGLLLTLLLAYENRSCGSARAPFELGCTFTLSQRRRNATLSLEKIWDPARDTGEGD